MPVTLSIKEVPDDMADALRQRARQNHRSIQGELMCILEHAVGTRPFEARALLTRVRAMGVKTKAEAASLVREARDRR